MFRAGGVSVVLYLGVGCHAYMLDESYLRSFIVSLDGVGVV